MGKVRRRKGVAVRTFALAVRGALLGITVLIGTLAPIASAAPTTTTSASTADIDPTLAWMTHPFPFSEPLFSADADPAMHVAAMVLDDPLATTPDDRAAQSPAIALPPAVMTGLGLLGVLAACMMLRRFACPAASRSF
jgi:hypothetical protein